jgi:hypothetical protein
MTAPFAFFALFAVSFRHARGDWRGLAQTGFRRFKAGPTPLSRISLLRHGLLGAQDVMQREDARQLPAVRIH